MPFSLSKLLNPDPRPGESQPDSAAHMQPPEAQQDLDEEQRSRDAQLTGGGSDMTGPMEDGTLSADAKSAHGTTQSGGLGDDSVVGRRPSSGIAETMKLPQSSATHGTMISPTLEPHHVSPRASDQRKASTASQQQSDFNLEPMQSLTAGEVEAEISNEPSHNAHSDVKSSSAAGTESRSNIIDHTATDGFVPTQVEAGLTQPRHSSADQIMAPDEAAPSPVIIKEEASATPRDSSPAAPRSTADTDGNSLKPFAALKHEQSVRSHSPLRESSIPVPSTENAAMEPTIPKKRAAPVKKKGTAIASKKAPAAKKRKLNTKQDGTPSSRTSKQSGLRTASSKGTPLNSSPAPSTRSQSVDSNDEDADDNEDMDDDEARENDGDLYCICRRPDTGTFMIGCDGTCDDWFHGKCVGVEERNKNLVETYMCPRCTAAGVGTTLWKRICRRRGCRQAARVGNAKNHSSRSKYCSDECGVAYFREMVAHTRGREDMARSRTTRKRGNAEHAAAAPEDDLGARGGVLSASEAKGLLLPTQSATSFRHLGNGVLSPPETPRKPNADEPADSSTDPTDPKSASTSTFTPAEKSTLAHIAAQKDAARIKHQLLKDRMKLVHLAKAAATAVAAERDLKPKDYCGYDTRLEWTDAQFGAWRASTAGRQAFETESLAPPGEDEDAMEIVGGGQGFEVCERKKCARHHEWGKLAVDDVRFDMSDNGDRMRGLDREEKGVREVAALRVKGRGTGPGGGGGVEGSVVMHEGWGSQPDDGTIKGEEGKVKANAALGNASVVDGVSADDTMHMEVDEVALVA